jgi:hypothetical protein
MSCANALILEDFLAHLSASRQGALVLTKDEICAICSLLSNRNKVDVKLRNVFEEIQQQRTSFILSAFEQRPQAWDAEFDKHLTNALRQWVANYEIGDYLANHSNSKRTHFVRLNQYAFKREATPDEAIRLERDEAQFGGTLVKEKTGEIRYGPKESVYFIQSFVSNDSNFKTPDEWAAMTTADANECANKYEPRVFVVDLQGHFAAAITCRVQISALDRNAVEPKGGTSTKAEAENGLGYENALILFNTTSGRYIDHIGVLWTFDSVFS